MKNAQESSLKSTGTPKQNEKQTEPSSAESTDRKPKNRKGGMKSVKHSEKPLVNGKSSTQGGKQGDLHGSADKNKPVKPQKSAKKSSQEDKGHAVKQVSGDNTKFKMQKKQKGGATEIAASVKSAPATPTGTRDTLAKKQKRKRKSGGGNMHSAAGKKKK